MATEYSDLRRGRMASATMFLVNGFLMGSWAPQIPLLLPRHQITETTLGLLIFLLGVGAVGAMALTGGLIGRYGSRGVLSFQLIFRSFQNKIWLAVGLFIFNLICIFTLARIGDQTITLQWVKQIVGTFSQGSFAIASWLLYRKTSTD